MIGGGPGGYIAEVLPGPRENQARARRFGWLCDRKLELAIFALGALLRMSMSWNYDPRWNFDSEQHWEVVTWITTHHAVPPTEATFSSFHPPLYYAAAAWLVQHGVTRDGVTWLSIIAGIVRLAIIWAGLEMYVKSSRTARVFALGLAATVAASVHMDGMNYPEPLSCMFNAAAMLVVPLAFWRKAERRWPWCALVGAFFGLALLTKVSALAVIGAVVAAVAIEFALSRRTLAEKVKDAVPWAGMVAVCVGLCGWYYARNVREYGTPFVTSFTLPSQRGLVAAYEKKPLLEHRPLSFLFGWSDAIYKFPFRPSGYAAGSSQFFPVLVASSVVDYWGFHFGGFEKPWSREKNRAENPNFRPLGLARAAAFGGTAVFLATAMAWLAATWQLVRARDVGRLALLLVPLFVLGAALEFAIAYPIDDFGVVKGAYLNFGAAPFYALFGLAAAWAGRKPVRWPLLCALFAALFFIASYSVLCRLGVRIWPA